MLRQKKLGSIFSNYIFSEAKQQLMSTQENLPNSNTLRFVNNPISLGIDLIGFPTRKEIFHDK